MAIPVGDSYSASSGVTIYGGREPPAPEGLPLWAADSVLNKLMVIPGSTGAGGTPAHAWGGYFVNQQTGEIGLAAQGGHGDSSDNRVVSYPLMDDVAEPAWVQRHAPSAVEDRVIDVNYYLDGLPTSRHIYDHAHYVPSVNRVIQIGGFGSWGNGNGVTASDGFNLLTNTWDLAGTWTYINGVGYGIALDTLRGHLWTNGFRRFDVATNAYLSETVTGITAPIRYPTCYDSLRDQLFCLMWGNAQDPSTTLNCSKWSAGHASNPQVIVSFNASAGYTQFVADALKGAYAGMTYDQVNDCFWWYSGQSGVENHLFKIIPNNTAVWDMELHAFVSGSSTMPTIPSSGVNGRVKYIELLNGIIICPTGTGDIYYMRTS